MSARGLLLAVAVCAAGGCGYHLSGTQVTLPVDVRSVGFGAFENRSREFGLDQALTFALEREFYRRGMLGVAENPDEGDAVLTGVIRTFRVRPVAFNAKDEAIQYEAEIVLDFVLRRRSDGAVLWKASALQEIEDYSVSATVIVPSSVQFQQGTLNPDDVNNLTQIQLAESEKRLAIQRLLAEVVRDVYDRIVEDF